MHSPQTGNCTSDNKVSHIQRCYQGVARYHNRKKRLVTIAAATALVLTSNPESSAFVPGSGVTPFLFKMNGETTSKYFRKQPIIAKRDETRKRTITEEEIRFMTKAIKRKSNVSDDSLSPDRTHSFPPQVSADKEIKIHTLILGTHPSVTSLAKVQYFAHPQNAFWWIAGDCLGFRRSIGNSPSSGKPYKLTNYVWHGEDKVIPYERQLEVLTSKGFALWDLFQSCERKGSLDNDIKDGVPNSIREFCLEHETINRIIMANGAKQCEFFNKYFEQWWLEGGLRPGQNELSQKAFGKWSKKTNGFRNSRDEEKLRQIEVFCMPGVSPAAASISYVDKREEFKKFCYDPGLKDHENW
jgi:G:T/U-mismatch repair DNA glycosylase